MDAVHEVLGRSALVEPGDGSPGDDALDGAVKALRQQHDDAHGGFGGAPKFPQAMSLDLLLRVLARRREYRSQLYVVRWPEDPAPQLDGRPVAPEVALL